MSIHPFREFITAEKHPHLFACPYADALLTGYTQGLGFIATSNYEDGTSESLFEGSGQFDDNWDVVQEIKSLLSPTDRDELLDDLESFLYLCKEQKINPCSNAARAEQAGTDLHLTRNRHGAGFWDGGWPKLGDRLTAIARTLGSCGLNGAHDEWGSLAEVWLTH